MSTAVDVAHVKASIERAEQAQSKLHPSVMRIQGLSSPKVRHLLNNLCNFDGCNYLEVGSWKGSTIISAAYKNHGHFTAIDSFRKWYGAAESPREVFMANRLRFKEHAPFTFHEIDSWEFDVSLLPPKVNVYFYDGDHTPAGTAKAFTHFAAALADTFILVMDDWNRGRIQGATLKAIKGSYNKLYTRQLFTPGHKNDPHKHPKSWWNGLYVALLQKIKPTGE